MIAYKKKEGLIEKVAHPMKRILLLLQRLRKKRSFPFRKTEAREPREIKRHVTCQRSDASTVRSLATMQKIATVKEESAKGNIMHLLLTWKMNHKERNQGNPPVDRIWEMNTISSQLSPEPSPTVLRPGWWIVVLLDT